MFDNILYRESKERYRRSVTKAQVSDLWGRITGNPTNLVRFEEVAQRCQARQQVSRGIRSVAMEQIVGSVGRATDFTRSFLPRTQVNSERWAQIDAMFHAMQPLPPVELYQIGTVYFVRDGHHRISVAYVNGLRQIEAYVTEVASPVVLTKEDFQ